MDLDWVVCPYCGNTQAGDCNNDSFICDECDEIFYYGVPYEKPGEE